MPDRNDFTSSASATALAAGILGDGGLLAAPGAQGAQPPPPDDGATWTVVAIDTPLELDDSAVFELERMPRGTLPADLVTRALERGMIAGNLRDASRAGSYARLSQFPVDVARAQSNFRPNQLEEHLQWCLLAFERIQRDRAAWAALFEKAFYVETELIQFAANEQVYAEEVDAGLYSNAYKEAYHDAEAVRQEAYFAQWSTLQLKTILDQKHGRIETEVAIDEFAAWMGTLSTYTDQRTKDDFKANQLVANLIGLQIGKKPDMTQRVAAWQSRIANTTALSMGRADEIARQGEASGKAERFQAAADRMFWELANGAFRRQRADNARAASFAKAAAFILPDGALSFRDQMDALQVRIGRDIAEVVARAAAIEEGLATFYGLDVVGRDSAVAIADNAVANLDQIDALYLWLRDCASELDRFRQFEQNYVLPISMRSLLGEEGWADALDSADWNFTIPASMFADDAWIRLRGLRLFARGASSEDGFWDARIFVPDKALRKNGDGDLDEIDQDVPSIRFPRLSARGNDERIEFVGVATLANASPISAPGPFGNWSIEIEEISTQRVHISKITDIELELAVAVRAAD